MSGGNGRTRRRNDARTAIVLHAGKNLSPELRLLVFISLQLLDAFYRATMLFLKEGVGPVVGTLKDYERLRPVLNNQ